MATLDEVAPNKKSRLICRYDKARDGFRLTVIRAGWRATGFHPFQPTIAIESCQVSARPATPPPAEQYLQPLDALIDTPQKPRDIHEIVKVFGDERLSPGSIHSVLQKAAKAVAMKNITVA